MILWIRDCSEGQAKVFCFVLFLIREAPYNLAINVIQTTLLVYCPEKVWNIITGKTEDPLLSNMTPRGVAAPCGCWDWVGLLDSGCRHWVHATRVPNPDFASYPLSSLGCILSLKEPHVAHLLSGDENRDLLHRVVRESKGEKVLCTISSWGSQDKQNPTGGIYV